MAFALPSEIRLYLTDFQDALYPQVFLDHPLGVVARQQKETLFMVECDIADEPSTSQLLGELGQSRLLKRSLMSKAKSDSARLWARRRCLTSCHPFRTTGSDRITARAVAAACKVRENSTPNIAYTPGVTTCRYWAPGRRLCPWRQRPVHVRHQCSTPRPALPETPAKTCQRAVSNRNARRDTGPLPEDDL